MRQAFAIVFCMALVNALRRSLFNLAMDAPAAGADLVEALLLGLVVGSLMVVAAAATLKRYPRPGARQWLATGASILLSSAFGVLAKDVYEWLAAADAADFVAGFSVTHHFLPDWLRYAVPGALLAAAALYFRSQAQDAALLHRCKVESAQMERQAGEARLRVLEAQIEPHFLFNTLASVKRLFRTDASAADRMLDDLMRYLSVALPRAREPRSCLGDEAALATAYLEIHRVRMGQRMHYRLHIPPHLRDARVPPFMLLTLVENAVKHGIGPLPEGGAIDVSAHACDGELAIAVRDNGRGLTGDSGAGTGLANLRARLQLLYGDRASLRFSLNEPSGVVATLALPLEHAPAPQVS